MTEYETRTCDMMEVHDWLIREAMRLEQEATAHRERARCIEMSAIYMSKQKIREETARELGHPPEPDADRFAVA